MAVHMMAPGWSEDSRQMETTYEGAVLDTYECNGHSDSDFYAWVWDASEGRCKSVQYATTRGWTYPNHAEVDATLKVRLMVAAHYYPRALRAVGEEAIRRARRWSKGDRVRIFKGRKAPIGTTGEAFWIGDGRYGQRVGIRQDDGEVVFTAASNIERDEWWLDSHLSDSRWLAQTAYKRAQQAVDYHGAMAAAYNTAFRRSTNDPAAHDPIACEVA